MRQPTDRSTNGPPRRGPFLLCRSNPTAPDTRTAHWHPGFAVRGLRLLINPGTLKSPYDARWQRYRLGFLRRNPLCVRCLEAGRTTAANTVDHIVPHRGDTGLFWAKDNHQSLCSTCHSGDKQRAEKSGNVSYRGSNTDGTPLDPNHAWAR